MNVSETENRRVRFALFASKQYKLVHADEYDVKQIETMVWVEYSKTNMVQSEYRQNWN